MTRTTAGAMTAVAVVLVLAGCAPAPSAGRTATPAATATAAAAPTPAVDVPVVAATPPPVAQPVAPVGVTVPSIGIEVPVVPVGVERGGFMELPVDPAIGGWYRFGAHPAAVGGNTVISAHVDAPGYPIGPFSRLRELTAGAVVEVTDAAGAAHRYAVQTVTYYAKAQLPVSELFAREGDRALVLITCGGAFDATTGRYADNVVAIATPTT